MKNNWGQVTDKCRHKGLQKRGYYNVTQSNLQKQTHHMDESHMNNNLNESQLKFRAHNQMECN